jgi:hypothetical protein
VVVLQASECAKLVLTLLSRASSVVKFNLVNGIFGRKVLIDLVSFFRTSYLQSFRNDPKKYGMCFFTIVSV